MIAAGGGRLGIKIFSNKINRLKDQNITDMINTIQESK